MLVTDPGFPYHLHAQLVAAAVGAEVRAVPTRVLAAADKALTNCFFKALVFSAKAFFLLLLLNLLLPSLIRTINRSQFVPE